MGLSVDGGRFGSPAAETERDRRMKSENINRAFLVTLDVNNATRYYT